jgi:hypothetical protein
VERPRDAGLQPSVEGTKIREASAEQPGTDCEASAESRGRRESISHSVRRGAGVTIAPSCLILWRISKQMLTGANS